jgi:hypothetical protein
MIENAIKSNAYPEKLEIKIGDQVICTKNISSNIVNGSQGIVKRFSIDGYPVVDFVSGREEIIKPHDVPYETIRGLTFTQVPLIYAWALTIHKCQGMSLDICQMDLGSNIFADGQAYVALSRVKTLSGLYITKFAPDSIKASERVKKFYKKHRDLEKEQKAAISSDTCTGTDTSTGLIDDKELVKHNMIIGIGKWIEEKVAATQLGAAQAAATVPVCPGDVQCEPRVPRSQWSVEEDTWIRENWKIMQPMLYDLYIMAPGLSGDKKMKGPFKTRVKRLKKEDLEARDQEELQKIPVSVEVYNNLKQFRSVKASEKGVPGYYIITNAQLDVMSRRKPPSYDELLAIKGIGKGFIEQYGDAVLSLINS